VNVPIIVKIDIDRCYYSCESIYAKRI